MPKYPHSLLVDTCFWFAYYESKDKFHRHAQEKASYLEKANILMPWPSLYETLNTRFVKKTEYIKDFDGIARRPSAILIDDTPYRDNAYTLTWSAALQGKRPISLADMVIRLLLDNINIKIDYMLTFNKKDFFDVCNARSINIL
jgi:predicted nucleic acid-binding protein